MRISFGPKVVPSFRCRLIFVHATFSFCIFCLSCFWVLPGVCILWLNWGYIHEDFLVVDKEIFMPVSWRVFLTVCSDVESLKGEKQAFSAHPQNLCYSASACLPFSCFLCTPAFLECIQRILASGKPTSLIIFRQLHLNLNGNSQLNHTQTYGDMLNSHTAALWLISFKALNFLKLKVGLYCNLSYFISKWRMIL